MSAISKMFDWVSLQKKRTYFFHEGAIEDKSEYWSNSCMIH